MSDTSSGEQTAEEKKKQKGGNEEIELNGKHASVDGNVLHKNKRV